MVIVVNSKKSLFQQKLKKKLYHFNRNSQSRSVMQKMIQLDIRSQSRTKNPTPTSSAVRNPTPTPPKNLRLLTTPSSDPTPQPCFQGRNTYRLRETAHAPRVVWKPAVLATARCLCWAQSRERREAVDRQAMVAPAVLRWSIQSAINARPCFSNKSGMALQTWDPPAKLTLDSVRKRCKYLKVPAQNKTNISAVFGRFKNAKVCLCCACILCVLCQGMRNTKILFVPFCKTVHEKRWLQYLMWTEAFS